jgi:hypothetical protein
MSKTPYIIMAPEYRHNSAGVRCLYELQRHLQERGYESTICQGGEAPEGSIVIYPETVCGNPLKGKTVVRYVLYHPSVLGGDKEYDSSEIIFTYSKRFYDAPLLTVPTIENFFKDEGLPREGGCFYVGKGMVHPDSVYGMTEITASWPEDRRELALLLNTKEVFYSFDDCTALIEEARRCGCHIKGIGSTTHINEYNESIKDFDKQLDNFIAVTQKAARPRLKIQFGTLVNDILRLDMVLRQSQIDPMQYPCHMIKMPTSATQGLNRLLGIIEDEGADIAILCHQDMYFRNGWLEIAEEKIKELPESWVVAGIIGKDKEGYIKGRMHDMRVPLLFDYDPLPCEASCFDECVIIVNIKKGFRFDETLTGFDLYGSMCVLQAEEMGGTAWIIDAFAEHYCMRPFTWRPDELFVANWKWLHERFPNAGEIQSTALGLPKNIAEKEREKAA